MLIALLNGAHEKMYPPDCVAVMPIARRVQARKSNTVRIPGAAVNFAMGCQPDRQRRNRQVRQQALHAGVTSGEIRRGECDTVAGASPPSA